ncbi:O-antigen ligase family protein [Vibrio fluminensis]|uniref:O-antigen ligase family protein n=1 Tax=Vibrio fluminensis TaxID=2783614 RepID=UPI001E2BEC29|nr:O-antigen ligase family protein [Vibrio fluminensis]
MRQFRARLPVSLITVSTIEKVIFASLLVMIIWLPIPLGSNRMWAWSLIQIIASIQSIVLLACYKGRLPFYQLTHYKYLLIPIGVFQVWVLLQTIPVPLFLLEFISSSSFQIYQQVEASWGTISVDSRITLVALFKGFSYTLLLINAIFLVNSSKRLKLVVITLIVSGTFQAFYGATYVLLESPTSPIFGLPAETTATGSFVYKNHLANYLMMTLCVGIGLIISQLHVHHAPSWHSAIRRTLEGILSSKMLVRLCLIIMVIALVMTRSRMGNSAFFFAVTFGGILALLIYKNRPFALPLLVASILLIDAIVIGSLFGLEKVKQRLVETSLVFESRDQVLLWALEIIKDFPVTGTGMASFYTIFPSYAQGDVGVYDHAHNDYLQFFVEAGIPATLLLATSVVFTIWRCFNTIRNRNSRTMKGISLGCMMAIVGMLIHMSVDFHLQPAANAVTFILILFLANACSVLPATGKFKHASISPILESREPKSV